jgi:hypothetical protein
MSTQEGGIDMLRLPGLKRTGWFSNCAFIEWAPRAGFEPAPNG